jgi:quercetin dioxygenase-like cupin family protein
MKRIALFLLVSGILFAQTAQEVEITAEPRHHQVLQNDQVRVFSVDVPPQTETLLHWHRHDYIFVTLGPTEIINAVKGKDPITQKLQDGDTRLVPGNFAHQVRDAAPTNFRNVTIELLQDEKLRHSTPKWDEDRGLHILEGGTEEILWVKDGVRATLFELQPGGMVPMHHHAGPHLAVALTEMKLRDKVEGKGAQDITFAYGEPRWIEGNYSHQITNPGPKPARWIIIEFP